MRFAIKQLLVLLLLSSLAPNVYAAQKADVANSKHNLTAFSLNVAGDTTDRVCVFCHTPHGATPDGGGFVMPLWTVTSRCRPIFCMTIQQQGTP